MKRNNDIENTLDNIEIEYSNDLLEENNENDDDIIKEKKPSLFRKLFFTLILVLILIVIYSRYIGPTGLIIKEYPIENSNITNSLNGFKIVHFSDFHYGKTTDINSLKKLTNESNNMKPDIVIFTGDLIDKTTKINDKEKNDIIEQLTKISSNYGKYYISGDDDLKLNNYTKIMDSSGFINLNDNFDVIYIDADNSILLTGTSLSNKTDFLDKIINENKSNYKINIMHYPDDFNNIKKYNYDLVLAGHSHNGQVNLPIYGPIIKFEHAKKYYKPYYKVDNTDLYISSGIGTTDFDFRFLNKPSFNFYRLTKK